MLKPKLQPIHPAIKEVALNYLKHLKIGEERADETITEGQLQIFTALVFRLNKYVEIICYTQYGKSLITALALLIISCIQGKLACIIAPSKEKAKLIMRYYIDHLGDHEIFYTQLEKNSKLERLKQEESKERIVLRNGGGVFCLSADQKNSKKSVEAAMGAGAEIVIGDEFCLIEDETEATIFRMITGKKSDDKLYCKIGNPFYSTAPNAHFKKDWDNPIFHKIFIDAATGIKEGRLNEEELEFAKTKPLFSILYDCEFPAEDEYDKDGYKQLIMSDQINYNKESQKIVIKMIQREKQLIKEGKTEELKKIPKTKLGADIGRGKDFNSYVVRKGNYSFIAGRNQSKDTMVNVNEIEKIMKTYTIKPEDVNIDDTGVGGGVVDRLKELGYGVNGVAFGGSSKSKEFSNTKAELYWGVGIWVQAGGQVDENVNWEQMTWIKYKQQTGEKKIIFESKENLRKRMRKSPDDFDSLALTFYEPAFVGFV